MPAPFHLWNDEFQLVPLVAVPVVAYSASMARQTAALVITLALVLAGKIRAQATEPLPDYAPLLPEVRAKALVVDPQKGYLVKELKPRIFMITDAGYESVFVATGKGVVVFDAPPSFAQHISEAASETTKEPIVMLVYSHLHVDHIGGAYALLQLHPKVQIVAENGTAEFLREGQDPHRPVPTHTFKEREVLKLGAMTADMKLGHWHTPDGDLLIYLTDQKFVIAIDALQSGGVPFMDLDLTLNMHDYLKVFDQLLALDLDVIVPGHHSIPAGRRDVETEKSCVMDVYNTVTRVLGGDHRALVSRAVETHGEENSFATARVLIDHEVGECAQEIKARWITKLEGVDVWAASHCRTALVCGTWGRVKGL
jgi:glyoxylase-like metal-dependent hydrolase (beta-lactamase superfamily II)